MNKKRRAGFFLCLAVIAIVGVFYLYFTWSVNVDMTKREALGLARTAEATFQLKGLERLEASPKDIKRLEYTGIKNSLMKLADINKDVSYIFIVTQKDGRSYIIADSEPEDSNDYMPPGELYDAVPEYINRIYADRTPAVTRPYQYMDGTWISVLLPMDDHISGNIMAVFGMVYSETEWYRSARLNTLQAAVLIACIIGVYILLNNIILKNKILRYDKNELMQANEKLAEKEELFRALFEQLPLGVSFGNLQSNILESNLMFQKIVGRSREELLRLHWMDITHPDDIQLDMESFERFKKGIVNGYSIKKRYLHPNGSIIWVNMTIAPLKIMSRNNMSHLCIVEDITETLKIEKSLKESERSMAMLLSNLPGMAYRCNYDRDWTMQFVSDGCYELTGYHPESLLYNKDISFNDLISNEYQEYLWRKWAQILETKGMLKEEYTIRTAGGEIKWVYEQGQGVYDRDGNVIALEGLIIDISLQKTREEEILFLTYHDVMTGLYNRRYFEEAKKHMDHPDYYPLSVIVGDINGLKLINSALGHIEGDKMILAVSEILRSCIREDDVLARSGGDEFNILLPKTSYEEADRIVNRIYRLCSDYKKKTSDGAYHLSISMGCATKTSSEETLAGKLQEAEESMFRHKLLQNISLHSSIISSLKYTLNEKSEETEEHAQRLIRLSRAIGKEMNLVEEQLNQLELLSTLHDIGKIGITDNILNKPGKLTEEEWVIMKKHPKIGYRIARATPELAPIADYILSHHERWDGKGYPYGLKEKEIPLLSRIIAVADAYDAMTSDRPYRKAMRKEEAITEIRNNAGVQFDPEIAEVFIGYIMKEK